MMKYIYHYFWFWKESFKFMKGYSYTHIIKGCLMQGHSFAKDMVAYNKLSPNQKDEWYINTDRRL